MIWDDIEAAKRRMGHTNSADFWPPSPNAHDRLAKATMEHFMELGGVGVGDGYIAEKIFPSFTPGAPEGVTGWNVYRQGPDGQLQRQNVEPLPLDQATYTVESHVVRNPDFEEPDPAPTMTPRDWRVAHMFLSIVRHRRYGYPIEEQLGRLHELDAWAREAGDVDLIVRVGQLRERLRRRFERISTNAPRPDTRKGLMGLDPDWWHADKSQAYLREAASWHGYSQLGAAAGAADQLLGVIKQNVEVVANTAQDIWVQIVADVSPALEQLEEIGAKLTSLLGGDINRVWPDDNLAECRVRHLHVVRRNISPRTIQRERMWVPPWRREDPTEALLRTQYTDWEVRKLYAAAWGPEAHLDHVHMTC